MRIIKNMLTVALYGVGYMAGAMSVMGVYEYFSDPDNREKVKRVIKAVKDEISK